MRILPEQLHFKMTKTEKLVLIEAKEIEIKDKTTGDKIKMWKYTFFNPQNVIVTGYRPDGEYAKEVAKGVSGFQEAKAFDYPFEGRVWDNQVKWKLSSRNK